MKIERARGPGAPTAAKRAAAAAAPGFALAADAPQRTAPAAGVGGVTPLDAILALQAEEGPAQKRARQARRGRAALDVLEKVERALVLGRAPAGLRGELEQAQRGGEATGEPDLDDLLREIDVRLAVEAAKLDRMLGRT